jgi:site-specific DNA-methyltransferase (adenine-specific)
LTSSLVDGERWRLVEGDCLDVLRAMPANSVDAVVTDPPYNVGLDYDSDVTGDRRHDYREWCGQWLTELRRICLGPVLVSCGVANLGIWHAIEKPRWVICWWKPASSGRCAVGFNNWEPMLLYGKLPVTVCDVVRTTEQASLPARHKKEGIAHPCPKPVEWAVKQAAMATKPGGLVLDPFAGSGTTGVACLQTGRRFIGVEISPAYCAIARKRLQEAEDAAPLFAGLPEPFEESPDLFAGGDHVIG